MESLPTPALVIIAIGSNLGEKIENLTHAIQHIDQLQGTSLVAVAPLYESEPWGDTDQDVFLNGAIAVRTTQTPDHFLRGLQSIEKRMGKNVVRHWGPRNIDLDIIWWQGIQLDQKGLTIPHPHAQDRPFVLKPLQDLEAMLPFSSGINASEVALKSEEETSAIKNQPELFEKRYATQNEVVSLQNLDGTKRLADCLSGKLHRGMVIGLNGELGAGKTTFVRCLCESLGVTDPVSSPSYTLCQEYQNEQFSISHWDFYRLQDSDDLSSTGFEELDFRDQVTLVEWSDLFVEYLPASVVRMEFLHGKLEEERLIKIEATSYLSLPIRAAIAEYQKEQHHANSCL